MALKKRAVHVPFHLLEHAQGYCRAHQIVPELFAINTRGERSVSPFISYSYSMNLMEFNTPICAS